MSSDKIKLLREQGTPVYPQTLSDAVLMDSESGKTLLDHIEENFTTKEEFQDNTEVMNKVEEKLNDFKDDILTALDDVADEDHNHDDRYSLKDHSHEEYLTKLPSHLHKYADIIFPKDILDNEKLMELIQGKIDAKKFDIYANLVKSRIDNLDTRLTTDLNDHNHDDRYSQLDHDHNKIYSAINHDHNDFYMPINKNFDDKYSQLNHNHDYNQLLNKPNIPTIEEIRRSIDLAHYDNLIEMLNININELLTLINNNDVEIEELDKLLDTKSDNGHEHQAEEITVGDYKLDVYLKSHEETVFGEFINVRTDIDNTEKSILEKFDNHKHVLADIEDIVTGLLSNGDKLATIQEVKEEINESMHTITADSIIGLDDLINDKTKEIIELTNELYELQAKIREDLESYTSGTRHDVDTIIDYLPKYIPEVNNETIRPIDLLVPIAPLEHSHEFSDLPDGIATEEHMIEILREFIGEEKLPDQFSAFYNDRVKTLVEDSLLNYSFLDHIHENYESSLSNLDNKIDFNSERVTNYISENNMKISEITERFNNYATEQKLDNDISFIRENYSDITHIHDDRYSQLDHNHDEKYAFREDSYTIADIDKKLEDLELKIDIEKYATSESVEENYIRKDSINEFTQERYDEVTSSINALNTKLDNYSTTEDLEKEVRTQVALSLSNKVDRSELDNYSTTEFNKSYYAEKNHKHEYSPLLHNHDEEYAPLNHKHENEYYTQEFINKNFSLLSHNHDEEYSDISHKHDGEYAPIGHEHDEYLSADIDLDSLYSKVNHEHSNYALKDDTARADHEHSGYATKEELENKAPLEHEHEQYARADHEHTDYITTEDAMNYANINHDHDDKYLSSDINLDEKYAQFEHEHEQYATTEHRHEDYALKSEVPSLDHKHDNYVKLEDMELYSTITHHHDLLYAPFEHAHTDYADIDHTHDGVYVKVDDEVKEHTHEEYALKGDVASSNHDHGDVYAITDHRHDELYMPIDKTFDEQYSSLEHEHEQYALSEHEHEQYALAEEVPSLNHNHDGRYSLNSHNHNGIYAPKDHSHENYEKLFATVDHTHSGFVDKELLNNNYYTKEAVDSKLGSHDHNNYYTKSETLTTAETELKILNAALGFTKDAIQEVIDETAECNCGCDCGQDTDEEGNINGVTITGTLSELVTMPDTTLKFTNSLFPDYDIEETTGNLLIISGFENKIKDGGYYLTTFGDSGEIDVAGLILESTVNGVRIYYEVPENPEDAKIKPVEKGIDKIILGSMWEEANDFDFNTYSLPIGIEEKGYKYDIGDTLTEGNLIIDGIQIDKEHFEGPLEGTSQVILLKKFFKENTDGLTYETVSVNESGEETKVTLLIKKEDYSKYLGKHLYYIVDGAVNTVIPEGYYKEEKNEETSEITYSIDRNNLHYINKDQIKLKYKNSSGITNNITIEKGTYTVHAVVDQYIGLSISKDYFTIGSNGDIKFGEAPEMSLSLGNDYKEIKLKEVTININEKKASAKTVEEIKYIEEDGGGTSIRISDAKFANLYQVLEHKITIFLSQEYDILIDKIKSIEKSGLLKEQIEDDLGLLEEKLKIVKEELESFLKGSNPTEEVPDEGESMPDIAETAAEGDEIEPPSGEIDEEETESSPGAGYVKRINSETPVNMYKEMNKDSDVLLTIEPDEPVYLIEELEDGWSKCKYTENEGYIESLYLDDYDEIKLYNLRKYILDELDVYYKQFTTKLEEIYKEQAEIALELDKIIGNAKSETQDAINASLKTYIEDVATNEETVKNLIELKDLMNYITSSDEENPLQTIESSLVYINEALQKSDNILTTVSEAEERIATNEKLLIDFLGMGEKITIPVINDSEQSEDKGIEFVKEDGNYVHVTHTYKDTNGENVSEDLKNSNGLFYCYVKTQEVYSSLLIEKEIDYFDKYANDETSIAILFEGQLDESISLDEHEKYKLPKPYIINPEFKSVLDRIEAIEKEIKKGNNHLNINKLNDLITKSCSDDEEDEQQSPVSENEEEIEKEDATTLNLDPLIEKISAKVKSEINLNEESLNQMIEGANGLIESLEDKTDELIDQANDRLDDLDNKHCELEDKLTELKWYKKEVETGIENHNLYVNAVIDNLDDLVLDFKFRMEAQLDNNLTYTADILEQTKAYSDNKKEEIQEIVNDFNDKCEDEISALIDEIGIKSNEISQLGGVISENLISAKDEYIIKLDQRYEDLSSEISEAESTVVSHKEDAIYAIQEIASENVILLDKVASEFTEQLENEQNIFKNFLEEETFGITNEALSILEEFRVDKETFESHIIDSCNIIVEEANNTLNTIISEREEYMNKSIDSFTDKYEDAIAEATYELQELASNNQITLDNTIEEFTSYFTEYISDKEIEIEDSHEYLSDKVEQLMNYNLQSVNEISNNTISNCNDFMITYDSTLSEKIDLLDSAINDYEEQISSLDNVIYEAKEQFDLSVTEMQQLRTDFDSDIRVYNDFLDSNKVMLDETVAMARDEFNFILEDHEIRITQKSDELLNKFNDNISLLNDSVASTLEYYEYQVLENIINEVDTKIEEILSLTDYEETLRSYVEPVTDTLAEFDERLTESEERIQETIDSVDDRIDNIEINAIERAINDSFMTKEQILNWLNENPSAHSHLANHVYGVYDDNDDNIVKYYYYKDESVLEEDRDYWKIENIGLDDYNFIRSQGLTRLSIDKIYATKTDIEERLKLKENIITDNVFNNLKDTVVDSIEAEIKENMEDGIKFEILKAYNESLMGNTKLPDFVVDMESLTLIDGIVHSYDEMYKQIFESRSNHEHIKYATREEMNEKLDEINIKNYYTKTQTNERIEDKVDEKVTEKFTDKIESIKYDIINNVSTNIGDNYALKVDFDNHISEFNSLKENMATANHTHSQYATKAEVAEKANFAHNHDGIYSYIDHTHSYQPLGDYVTREEVEQNIVLDGIYARVDDTYSKEVVYTKAEVNGLLTEYHADFVKKDEIYSMNDIDEKINTINENISNVNKLPEDVYTKQEVLDLLQSSIEHMHKDYMDRITALEQRIAELEGK